MHQSRCIKSPENNNNDELQGCKTTGGRAPQVQGRTSAGMMGRTGHAWSVLGEKSRGAMHTWVT